MNTPILRRKAEKPNNLALLGIAAFFIVAFLFLVGAFFVFSNHSSNLVGKCVAVVTLDQEITTQSSPPSLFSSGIVGSDEIASTLRNLNRRNDVGSVLLVVNSPGGSVVATREIYDAYKSLKVPKVSYFREVAASGGYYVGSAGDYIISEPNALTGSIGVITTFSDLSSLFEKIGYNVSVIKSGPYKDIGSPSREMTSSEREIIQQIVSEIYLEFKGVVEQNRRGKLNMALFQNATDGRVMSGRGALNYGLVDQIGTKYDALEKAASLANISYDSVEDIRVCPVQFENSGGSLFGVESFISKFYSTSSSPSLNYR
jgi:protease-4